jgi:predicted small lipoprotein YifL
MTGTNSQWWPGILVVIALVMGISGCGLKGDLYLDKPKSDQAKAEGSATSTDAKTTGDWTDRLQIEETPAAGSQGAGAGAAALEEASEGTSEGVSAETPEASAEISEPASVTTDRDPTTSEMVTPGETENPAENTGEVIEENAGTPVDNTSGEFVEPTDVSTITATDQNTAVADSVTALEGDISAEEIEDAPEDSAEPVARPENTELETDANISEPSTTLAPEDTAPAP